MIDGRVAFRCEVCRKTITTVDHFAKCACGAMYVTSVLRIDQQRLETLPVSVRSAVESGAAG